MDALATLGKVYTEPQVVEVINARKAIDGKAALNSAQQLKIRLTNAQRANLYAIAAGNYMHKFDGRAYVRAVAKRNHDNDALQEYHAQLARQRFNERAYQGAWQF
jgi:hypothetical protein